MLYFPWAVRRVSDSSGALLTHSGLLPTRPYILSGRDLLSNVLITRGGIMAVTPTVTGTDATAGLSYLFVERDLVFTVDKALSPPRPQTLYITSAFGRCPSFNRTAFSGFALILRLNMILSDWDM